MHRDRRRHGVGRGLRAVVLLLAFSLARPPTASAHLPLLLLPVAVVCAPYWLAKGMVAGTLSGIEAAARPLAVDPAPPGRPPDDPGFSRLENLALLPVNLASAATFQLIPSAVVLADSVPDASGARWESDHYLRLDGLCWNLDAGCGLWEGEEGAWWTELGRAPAP